MTAKDKLRQEIKSIRKNLPEEFVFEKSRALCEKLYASEDLMCSDAYFLYSSVRNEISVTELALRLLAEGKTVCFPVCDEDTPGEMVFKKIERTDDFVIGKYSIPEPSENCKRVVPEAFEKPVIIVPGVAFTEKGERLGNGAGYYDRYLSAHEGAFYSVVGVCYSFQTVNEIPCEPFDEKMEKIFII